MLPAQNRLRRSADFSTVVRSGARARRGALVIHVQQTARPAPAQVGLIVGKSVGNSVLRHSVSRRLRAQLAARLELFPSGSMTVIRAMAGASTASSNQLGADLDSALTRVLR